MIGALRRLLEAHSGAMVALVPDEPEGLQLHGAGSLDADDLHVTLAYLGDAADLGADQRQAILAEVRLIASQLQPAECECSAPAVFGGEEQAAVALLQGRELVALRQALERTETVGALMDTETYPVFMPHLTLGYGYPHDAGARQGERFTASHLLVAFGDERHLISLASEEPCCDACGESGGSCERQLEAVAWGAEAAERIVESHSEGWSDLTAEGRRGRWVGALCDLARERPLVGSLALAAAQLEGMGFSDGAAVLQEAACLPGQRSDLTGCTPKKKEQAKQRIDAGEKRGLRKRPGSPLTKEGRAEAIKVRDQVLGRARDLGDASIEAVGGALDNADWWAGKTNVEAHFALEEMARAVEADDFEAFYSAMKTRAAAPPSEGGALSAWDEAISGGSAWDKADTIMDQLLAGAYPDGRMSYEQAKSIRYYTGVGYAKINEGLRSGQPLHGAAAESFQQLDPLTRRDLAAPVQAYRGFGPGKRTQQQAASLVHAGVGAEVQLNGINSWAVDPGVAQSFSESLVRLKPGGQKDVSAEEAAALLEDGASVVMSSVLTRGAPVPDEVAETGGETEILTPHQGRFVVVGYRASKQKIGKSALVEVVVREAGHGG